MARDDPAALALVAALGTPLGVRPTVLARLADEVVNLAERRGVAWRPLIEPARPQDDLRAFLAGDAEAKRGNAEAFCRACYDVIFSSRAWRREIGYAHPMDEAR